MNHIIRRATTVTAAVGGSLALLTGTAAAHFCIREDVPEKSKMANGQAWSTFEELKPQLTAFGLPQACVDAFEAHFSLEENADDLFMGPGLLAGGTLKNGKSNTPEQFGYLLDLLPVLCGAPGQPA